MNKILSWGASLVVAWFVAGCGGSDFGSDGVGAPAGAPTTPGAFTSVVSFGDSLSDVGTYTPATSVTGNGNAPFIGGRFTTNGPGNTVWVENVASALGIPLTAAEVGFGTASVACPAATVPALAASCTAYGQGGSRVTDPEGIGRRTAGNALAALTVPAVRQIERHLTRFGRFQDSDLVFVYAGSNDALVQFAAFAATSQQVQARVAAGELSAGQGEAAVADAQAQAQAAMRQAALELAAAVRTQILGQGGRYVAVMLLSDIADTPFGLSLQPEARAVLTDLSRVFNLWLRSGLDQAPVQLIDTFSIFKETFQNPQRAGIANATQAACDPQRIALLTAGRVTDGSSLFCNSTPGSPLNGLRSGADPQTWLFADSVHPTTRGHELFSDAVEAQLRAFGWIR